MSKNAFDPFGHPVSYPGNASGELQSPELRRVGIGAFWVSIVAILIARAMYFVPDLGAKFEAVASVVCSCLGA